MLVEEPQKRLKGEPSVRPRRGGRAVLFAGVAGACALGVGLGLWARPALHERPGATVQPPEAMEAPPATARKLQIVVDDRPPPPAAPIEVLRAADAAPRRAAPWDAGPWRPPVAPKAAPPEGLIRTQEVSSPAPERPHPLIAPQAITAVVPAIASAIAGARLVLARAEAPPPPRHAAKSPPPIQLEAAPPPKPPRHPEDAKVRLAALKAAQHKAASEKIAAGKLALAQITADKAAKAEAAREKAAEAKAARIELAKAQTAKAAAHKLELAQAGKAKAAQAKAAKAEQVRLAAAEARGRAEAREEARQDALADARKQARLAALAHVLARALPHRARPDPEPVEVVKVAHHRGRKGHEPKVEQAALRSRHAHETARTAPHVARARPELAAPDPGSGLMKVSTPRCARSDPGEAMVCANPGLSAADRQLSRAYQGARAAGVPDDRLRSQQQRWLAARSAAAREAPWAVRDVYMARIAELNGQAKDARDGY